MNDAPPIPQAASRLPRRSAEIVPQARMSGPIPWVIAIMVALMVVAAAGGLALRNTGKAAARELSGGITVQIVEARPAERDRQARAALALLQRAQGVTEPRIVPQAELDALVEPWLGEAVDEQAQGGGQGDSLGVPVPALIDARLAGSLAPARLAALQEQLRRTAPSARVDDQAIWLRPVFGAAQSLQWLAVALIVLLSGATGAAVLLAARTALGNNRETIEIVHLLGGTDAQIAAIFQRSIAFDAIGGGVVGFGAAFVVIALLGRSFAQLQAGIVTGSALGWMDWALLALVPAVAAVVATITARWTVMRALRRML
ncbi:cell division protein [Novosphingobium flavum]|uniref:Cell division protein n=1 Tax=Novosphingobium flavum TaxID=1778672 RepID=A0A7X1FUH1_9SPHN|nr:cell division protein [Novosphingobium flavum]MBC2667205.1 cell division protein [Novosphingobium flavum]